MTPQHDTPTYSIVVPVYLGADCLPELHRRIVAVLEGMDQTFELVLVDDRSPDDAWSVIQSLSETDQRVRGVRLSRNFGQMRAIGAGLDFCSGARVVVMDCDLQDPPEEIPRLAAAADEGAEVVLVRRTQRVHSVLRRLGSVVFFEVARAMSQTFLQQGVGTLSLLSRRVAKEYVNAADEHSHYLATLHWLGFTTVTIEVPQAPRFAGRSSYTLPRLIHHAFDGLVSQTTRLLQLSSALGVLFALFAGGLAAWFTFHKLVYGVDVPGWASLMVSIWFVGGAVLGSMGVLGLYVGQLIQRSQGRPLFVVERVTGEEP